MATEPPATRPDTPQPNAARPDTGQPAAVPSAGIACAPAATPGDGATAACAPQLDQATHDFLKALANEGRQQIMLLFAQGAELSVNQVAERAGISQSAASQQLALLRRGGIVTARRAGKEMLYRGDRDSVARILGDLQNYLKFCC
ncbi:ArsR/SmtB family transcription factor [Nonomuraea sp. SBT364]|uniref:ArsR/SmtB family transcription factor n=1 Tax=Nonomuraea sp. SBT364 TaxID=1580530 RepID=UPI0009EC9A8D|nr:metalloregulator ArsR/SmtB family transcription factor [Nonomuraea sp. SBT364]